MITLPNKDYSLLPRSRQLFIPLDVEILIPCDSAVRLLRWMLEQFDLRPLQEMWETYLARRRYLYHQEKIEGKKQEALYWFLEMPEMRRTDEEREPKAYTKSACGRPGIEVIEILSIIIYSYMTRNYSSRSMARACRENISFMWLLNGKAAPSHELLNAFRKHVLRKTIEPLFYEMIKFLEAAGEISFKNGFIDGTKVEANANRYTSVWRKNLDRYEKAQGEKIRTVIEETNGRDGTKIEYDVKEPEGSAMRMITYLSIKIEMMSKEQGEEKRYYRERKRELEGCVKKLWKYAQMRLIMGERNSYSKTDRDATFMRMKDERLLAAYNAQIAVEGEYITGCGIFQNGNDINTLIPFLERIYKMTEMMYENIITDAGYESEENYVYLEKQGIKAFIKPVTYEKEKTGKFKKDISKRENMKYDAEQDEYICANGKKLRAVKVEKRTSKSGYESEVTVYQCEECAGCPYRELCTKAKENRSLQVSKVLLEKRAQSKANIESEYGTLLRVNRSIQAEGAFGVEKEDYHFRRFLTRKKDGVECELFLLCFGYNLNKVHSKIQNARRGVVLHPLKAAA